jgi:hypothetical protein
LIFQQAACPLEHLLSLVSLFFSASFFFGTGCCSRDLNGQSDGEQMTALRLLLWRLGLLLALTASSHQQSQPYDDFTWVKTFAIVGDSYTAGIGAGSLIDYDCSRYDGSYAVMMSKFFAGLRNVYNKACTGAKTPDILTQVESLPGGLDLAVLTAGGNDLCLVRPLCVPKPPCSPHMLTVL